VSTSPILVRKESTEQLKMILLYSKRTKDLRRSSSRRSKKPKLYPRLLRKIRSSVSSVMAENSTREVSLAKDATELEHFQAISSPNSNVKLRSKLRSTAKRRPKSSRAVAGRGWLSLHSKLSFTGMSLVMAVTWSQSSELDTSVPSGTTMTSVSSAKGGCQFLIPC